jgi:hypothetical protein
VCQSSEGLILPDGVVFVYSRGSSGCVYYPPHADQGRFGSEQRVRHPTSLAEVPDGDDTYVKCQSKTASACKCSYRECVEVDHPP